MIVRVRSAASVFTAISGVCDCSCVHATRRTSYININILMLVSLLLLTIVTCLTEFGLRVARVIK